MKLAAIAYFFFFLLNNVAAQKIQTIVLKQVTQGTAFQIQYVVTEPSNLISVNAPAFDSLQLVSGPNYYNGNATVDGKLQPIKNITYTVVCSKIGKLKINGITANFKNAPEQKANDVFITVVAAPNASFKASSSYTDVSLFEPSSKADIDKLISDNLFVKAEVDRTTCYIGEPVVVTFKLFSRLQSTSEVINAPGLYGFSVIDVLNINAAHQSVETINGKVFNTSILRKVQLYPEQAGKLTIDAMQLNNEIEFDDSLGRNNKKVEKEIASAPVIITVKSLPAKKPENYTGAVGQFSIDAHFAKSQLPLNEQGKLIFTISGKGNFIQFSPPIIQWPKGMDVSEPVVSDSIDKTITPTAGKRIYEYNFTVDSTTDYHLPPISFSFFDLQSNTFKTVTTDALTLKVTNAIEKPEADYTTNKKRNRVLFWIIIAVLLACSLFFILKKKKTKKPKTEVVPILPLQTNFTEKLSQLDLETISDKQACIEMQKLINQIILERNLNSSQAKELQSIKNDCQLIIYSDISSEEKRFEIKNRLLQALQNID